jgi:5-formyltetrahydrofolate cyclo-ligase
MQKEKVELRELIEKRIQAMSANDAAAESRSLCRRIREELSFFDYAQDDTLICGFYSITNEVDIRPLLEELLKDGRALYLPRMEAGKTVYRRVTNLSVVRPGTYGIPEPPADAEELPSGGSCIALIPGRAYDRMGARLGRGNGGYDHWISDMRMKNLSARFWGICFECQLLPDIPMEPHDQRVDIVLTARGKVG